MRAAAVAVLLVAVLALPAVGGVALPTHTGYRSTETVRAERVHVHDDASVRVDARVSSPSLRIDGTPSAFFAWNLVQADGAWHCETWRFQSAGARVRLTTYDVTDASGSVQADAASWSGGSHIERWRWRNETLVAGVPVQAREEWRDVPRKAAWAAQYALGSREPQHVELVDPVGDVSSCAPTSAGAHRVLFTGLPAGGTGGVDLAAMGRAGHLEAATVQKEVRSTYRLVPPNAFLDRFGCGGDLSACLP